MTRTIFINLPVTDLARSIAFYEALGFTKNAAFSDDTAACMVLSDIISVMLITHAKWATFTKRPIPSSKSSEVSLCFSCGSKDEVNHLTATAARFGGTSDVNPAQDHGFMYGRSFTDPDGHLWEPMWMDSAAMPQQEPKAAAS